MLDVLAEKQTNKKYAPWLFAVLVLLLNLPNFFWLSGTSNQFLNAAEWLARLVQASLLSAVFLALFTRPQRAFALSWLLILSWAPVAIVVRLLAGTPISQTLIGTAAATSPAELYNLLTSISWHWAACFVLWNLLCFGIWRWLRLQPDLRWTGSFRGKMAFFCLSMLALPYIVLPNATNDSVKTPAATEFAHPLHQFNQSDISIGSSIYLPQAFPYELPWAIAQYIQAKRVVDAVRARLPEAAQVFSLQGYAPAADVVVLVIGESSTRNAWHVFNAQAPATTVKLEQRLARGEALFVFGKTLAQTTATRLAVPSIVGQQPLVWPDGTPNPQATKSVVSVAEQAGYATGWFSNQTAIGKHDGIIASYAGEAQTVAFLNPSSFGDQGSYDEILLPAVRRQLGKHGKIFLVLHTMGSHFNYLHRYPAGFGPFPDTSSDREAYFNSVAYTDHLLNQVIELLTTDERRAVLLYVSDHGETVPQGVCNAGSANRYSRDAYEIPALVWLSQSYAQQQPDIARQLAANQQQYFQASAAPQTLLDLMRGDNQAELPQDTQSFARSQQGTPDWAKSFERIVERRPCAIFSY